jgi:hypothetical protein
MKFVISLGLCICLPLLSFAQKSSSNASKTSELFLNYRFITNFDHMNSNQFGLGVELNDRFDIELTTSYNTITDLGFFNILDASEPAVKYQGQLSGAAVSYRALPGAMFRPVVGVGIEGGKLKDALSSSTKDLVRLYGRIGFDYQILDFLTIGTNVNIDMFSIISYTDYGVSREMETVLKAISNTYLSLYTRINLTGKN